MVCVVGFVVIPVVLSMVRVLDATANIPRRPNVIIPPSSISGAARVPGYTKDRIVTLISDGGPAWAEVTRAPDPPAAVRSGLRQSARRRRRGSALYVPPRTPGPRATPLG